MLRRVSFSARRGEVVAIVGTSGAGKTTLVNLLPRFYDVTRGRDPDRRRRRARRRRSTSLREQIGLVTQETVLFNDTVRANIAYGLEDVDEARIESAARAAFAHDFILDLPRRYDTVIGERGSRLSGGQRQRIAIARAILKDPPILILDEATSALDAESERLVQERAREPDEGPHDARDRAPARHGAQRRPHRRARRRRGARRAARHDELLDSRAGIYSRLHDLQFRPRTRRCEPDAAR